MAATAEPSASHTVRSQVSDSQLISALKDGVWVKETSDWHGRNIKAFLVPDSFVKKHDLQSYLPKKLPTPDAVAGRWFKGLAGDFNFLSNGKDVCAFLRDHADYKTVLLSPAHLTPSLTAPPITMWLAKDPRTNLAIFQGHRNDPDGVFQMGHKGVLFMAFLRRVFGPECEMDDSIITCGPERSLIYRGLLAKHFRKGALEPYREVLTKLIDERIAQWLEDSSKGKSIDLIEECHILAGDALNRVLFGHALSDSAAVSRAATAVQDYLVRSIKAGGADPRADEQAAIDTLVKALKEALTSKDSAIIRDMQADENFSDLQLQIMLFALILAGKDNVALLMSYLLMNVIDSPEQRKLLQEAVVGGDAKTIKNFHREALRLASGAYASGKPITQRVFVIIRDQETSEKLLQVIDPVGSTNIDACPHLAGRNPHLFKKPDTFDPTREEVSKVMAKVKPFGHGPHRCPAEYWAMFFTQLFQERFWSHCDIAERIPADQPQLVGGFTLKLVGTLPVVLAKRG